MSDVADQSSLPILPEIVQIRTPADTFHAPPPLPCLATPVANAPSLLSERQLNAIPLILAGQSDAQVASAVGVRRQAICNWRNRHPRFIAELNRQRTLRHASLLDRHTHLLHRSLDFVEQFYNYTHEDWRPDQRTLALAFLRTPSNRRVFTPAAPTPLPTHPDDILDALHAQNLTPCPDDSAADDAPPPPPPAPPTPKKSRK